MDFALKNRALGGEEKEKRSTIAKKFKALFTSLVKDEVLNFTNFFGGTFP